jgi:homoserine O-acetyltransferase
MPRTTILLACLALGFLGTAAAHQPTDPPHQLHPMGDFKLESGETIKDFNLSYVTHGTLNSDKSNAVLLMVSIGGNHHRTDYLIGPGRALDPARYFIIAVDAIGNGLTTSPSNSKAQPGMQFPRFNIRDMVNSAHRLGREKFGIERYFAVGGASMGGMQALQFAVSYPDAARSVIAIIPIHKATPWTTNVLELSRQIIMLDPAWNGGNYPASAPPEKGMRAWARYVFGEITRTPEMLQADLGGNGAKAIEWSQGVENTFWKRIDARDWVYQTWAYDQHDVGTTPGFNGDSVRALKSIKAKTLILAGEGDHLNPEANAKEAAELIPGARYVTIKVSVPMGHWSGAGATPPENALQNREIGAFLETVSKR